MTDPKPPERRGITHAYQTDQSTGKDAPSYHKHRCTLERAWDGSGNNARKTEAERQAKARQVDQAIHKTPVSRKQVNRLKEQRAVARAQAALTPKGPMNTRVLTTIESIRERQIHFQEKRLNRQQGEAERAFKRSDRSHFKQPQRSSERCHSR